MRHALGQLKVDRPVLLVRTRIVNDHEPLVLLSGKCCRIVKVRQESSRIVRIGVRDWNVVSLGRPQCVQKSRFVEGPHIHS